MISRTGRNRRGPWGISLDRGFTLIELIVVMAVLSVTIALSAPSLSRFFTGRMIEEEARRLLALTRYTRSEAISSAVPMRLWIDAGSGRYGMSPQLGFESEDVVPIEYEMPDDLGFELDITRLSEFGTLDILYQPDGSIEEGSLEYVLIRDAEDEWIGITRADYGQGYVIRDNENDEWIMASILSAAAR